MTNSESKPVKVLFADDQIPTTPEEDDGFRRETLRVRPDLTPEQYDEDLVWFRKLLRFLQTDMGFQVETTRVWKEALDWAKFHEYDVAVVDLTWYGDKNVVGSREDKEKEGLKILEQIARTKQKPTIALSQRFTADLELFSSSFGKGALCIPKQYTEDGIRTIAFAIAYLDGLSTRSVPVAKEEVGTPDYKVGTFLSRFLGMRLDDVGKLYKALGAVLAALGVIVAGAYTVGQWVGGIKCPAAQSQAGPVRAPALAGQLWPTEASSGPSTTWQLGVR